MYRFAVIDHKNRIKGYSTWKGAKNAWGMAAWRMVKNVPAYDEDAISQLLISIDRVMEWDLRTAGSMHRFGSDGVECVTIKSMIP